MRSGFREPRNWLVLLLGAVAALPLPFLSSVFLRIARNTLGPVAFWLVGLWVATGAFFVPDLSSLFVLAFSLWVLVGLYAAFESRGVGNFWTGSVTVFAAALVAWQGPHFLEWVGVAPIDTSLQKNLEVMVNRIDKDPSQRAWIEAFGLTKEVLLAQLPSVLVLLYLMCLAFALVFDRRLAAIFRVRFEYYAGAPKLLEFRLPEPLIWVFLVSFLLSFLKLGTVSVVALNFLQILLGAYFFQGLAILETAMLIFRFGPFFKAMTYILIVGNLFFLLSLVGLADYWIDFRQRLKRWKLKQSKAE